MSDTTIYEIAKEVFLIKSDEHDFHRNIYLKRFIAPDGTVKNMIFDPGTKLDLPNLLEALKKLTGGIQEVDFVFLSHQDPDVSANINMILTTAPRAVVLASLDTWRLVKMYGLPEKRFWGIENLKSETVKIKKTGHKITFIPALYAHFRGAMMVYDYESDVLFPGDFLGGLNTRGGSDIYATEESWKGISLFHQLYIPCNRAVQNAIGKIGMLPKIPGIVAPQHGDILKGKIIETFMDRLMQLDVGLDISSDKSDRELILLALNKFLEIFQSQQNEYFIRLMSELKKPGEFTTFFTISENTILNLKISEQEAISFFWETTRKHIPGEILPLISALFVDTMEEFGIHIPPDIASQVKKYAVDEELFS